MPSVANFTRRGLPHPDIPNFGPLPSLLSILPVTPTSTGLAPWSSDAPLAVFDSVERRG